jgi:prefoldin subunit 5
MAEVIEADQRLLRSLVDALKASTEALKDLESRVNDTIARVKILEARR